MFYTVKTINLLSQFDKLTLSKSGRYISEDLISGLFVWATNSQLELPVNVQSLLKVKLELNNLFPINQIWVTQSILHLEFYYLHKCWHGVSYLNYQSEKSCNQMDDVDHPEFRPRQKHHNDNEPILLPFSFLSFSNLN